jgi:pimeloyl-ACP methyl ester carboxylesterase
MNSFQEPLTHESYHLSNGRTLSYAVAGARTGYPVVVHHGTPGSRLFASLLSEVAKEKGVKLVVPDRPGYGRSSPPPANWTWRDWQQDLSELLQEQSIDTAAVLGFSGGGPFALAASTSDWVSRIALVSSVIPPARNGLAKLSVVPFALRLLFRSSSVVARVRGPNSVVSQYTDKSVSTRVARQIATDFQEALRQNAKAVARENRSLARASFDPDEVTVPLQAYHGTEDSNTPIGPVRTLVSQTEGELVSAESDHLGTLLERKAEILEWLQSE